MLHSYLEGDVYFGGKGLQLLFGREVDTCDGYTYRLLGEDVGIELYVGLVGDEFASFDG